jgi:molybdate/tungstate transport system substrate-binding protein
MRLIFQILFQIAVLGLLGTCRQSPGTLRIIHAGSLTVPVKEIADSFTRQNPGTRVLTEAWGSRAGARRVSDLDIPCDVFISADYKVIDDFLIPGHASWNISFAGNEMSLAYNKSSLYAGEINSCNWHEILLRDDVVFGRSDPDSDPCGVRTVMTAKLSGIFYDKPGLPEMLLSRHSNMMRPKETDLIALLSENVLDYIFIYRSIALQHNMEHLLLPDEINLRDPHLNEWYAQACTELRGARPGESIKEKGQAMVYGITIPHKSRNRELAESFVGFFLSAQGVAILERNGQNGMVPSFSATFEEIPGSLRPYALSEPLEQP